MSAKDVQVEANRLHCSKVHVRGHRQRASSLDLFVDDVTATTFVLAAQRMPTIRRGAPRIVCAPFVWHGSNTGASAQAAALVMYGMCITVKRDRIVLGPGANTRPRTVCALTAWTPGGAESVAPMCARAALARRRTSARGARPHPQLRL